MQALENKFDQVFSNGRRKLSNVSLTLGPKKFQVTADHAHDGPDLQSALGILVISMR